MMYYLCGLLLMIASCASEQISVPVDRIEPTKVENSDGEEQNSPALVNSVNDEAYRIKELQRAEVDKIKKKKYQILGQDREMISKVSKTSKKKRKKDKVEFVKGTSNKIMVSQVLDYHCIKFEGKIYKDSKDCERSTEELLVKCKNKVGLEQYDLLSCLRKEFMRKARRE